MEHIPIPSRDTAQENEKQQEILGHIKVLPIKAQTEILQVMHDLRPVACITVISRFKERMQPALDALEKVGFLISDNRVDSEIYYFSKDAAAAEEAKNLFLQKNNQDHRRLGELMGFPPASVEAFLNDKEDILTEEELTNALGFKNYFFPVKFSRSHLVESLQYLKDSYRILLEQAPNIIESGTPRNESFNDFKQRVIRFVYA